jgi:hypothetical protein
MTHLFRRLDGRPCETCAGSSNPLLLSAILRNPLTNAIKYTEPGGRIAETIKVSELRSCRITKGRLTAVPFFVAAWLLCFQQHPAAASSGQKNLGSAKI